MKKSPIYRTGNKEKNLSIIKKLLPKNINCFYDVFGGSGIVGMNSGAKKIMYNEKDLQTFKIIEYIKNTDNDVILKNFETYKNKNYQNDRQFFEYCKKDYNENRSIEKLWYVTFMSFCNSISFNSNGDINVSFGERFSKEKLYNINNFSNIYIYNLCFKSFIQNIELNIDNFIFFDPPYLNSGETNKTIYNNNWIEEDEKKLLKYCQILCDKNIKFMITNVLKNKNSKNNLLQDFIIKNNLKVIPLNSENESFGKKNNSYTEVAIINYEEPIKQLELF
jgi:DNA adenine methylase Dam